MMRQIFFIFVLAACLISTASALLAASAYSSRHSGLEGPNEPKSSPILPGKNASRTPQGGMGYTDAYGNTIDDVQPEEKKTQRRLSPGAYGPRGAKEPERSLPDPQASRPLWSFQ